MLFLLFELGQDRYALQATRIAEVLPLVRIKQIPQAPAGVAGMFSYRGAPVPVLDLAELALGRPAQRRLSTRILLVHYGAAAEGGQLLGLIVERATEMLRREPAEFRDPGLSSEATPYLGPVTSDARGLVQRIEIEQLLPPALQALLFRTAEPG
ncbi:MAG TPA: chemotaxis protein CheW [Solimonas sp.]|nr:chemotaxis protein CheW [Solimonas sp.]